MDAETRSLLNAAADGKIKSTRRQERILRDALGEALLDLRELAEATQVRLTLEYAAIVRLRRDAASRDGQSPPASE